MRDACRHEPRPRRLRFPRRAASAKNPSPPQAAGDDAMKIRNKTLNRLLARGAARLLTVWLRTCRVEVVCDAGTSPFAGRLGEPGRPTASRRLGGGLKHDPAAPHTHGFYPVLARVDRAARLRPAAREHGGG